MFIKTHKVFITKEIDYVHSEGSVNKPQRNAFTTCNNKPCVKFVCCDECICRNTLFKCCNTVLGGMKGTIADAANTLVFSTLLLLQACIYSTYSFS